MQLSASYRRFSTHCHRACYCYACFVFILLFFFSSQVVAERADRLDASKQKEKTVYAEILSASTVVDDGIYLLNSEAKLDLPRLPAEALDSGLSLMFVTQVTVERKRGWWWFDEVVSRKSIRCQLEYLQLTKRYSVKHRNDGARITYGSLAAALQSIAVMRDYPLIESRRIKSGERYRARLSLSLDTEALPLPLRPQAFLSSQWSFNSRGYTWDLQ